MLPEAPTASGHIRLVRSREGRLPADSKVFSITTRRSDPNFKRYFLSVHIVDSIGRTVLQLDSRLAGMWVDHCNNADVVTRLELRTPWLKPGAYTLDIFVCNAGVVDQYSEAAHFKVHPNLPYRYSASEDAWANTLVFADFDWEQLRLVDKGIAGRSDLRS